MDYILDGVAYKDKASYDKAKALKESQSKQAAPVQATRADVKATTPAPRFDFSSLPFDPNTEYGKSKNPEIDAKIREAQQSLGVKVDGDWKDKSSNAYRAYREQQNKHGELLQQSSASSDALMRASQAQLNQAKMTKDAKSLNDFFDKMPVDTLRDPAIKAMISYNFPEIDYEKMITMKNDRVQLKQVWAKEYKGQKQDEETLKKAANLGMNPEDYQNPFLGGMSGIWGSVRAAMVAAGQASPTGPYGAVGVMGKAEAEAAKTAAERKLESERLAETKAHREALIGESKADREARERQHAASLASQERIAAIQQATTRYSANAKKAPSYEDIVKDVSKWKNQAGLPMFSAESEITATARKIYDDALAVYQGKEAPVSEIDVVTIDGQPIRITDKLAWEKEKAKYIYDPATNSYSSKKATQAVPVTGEEAGRRLRRSIREGLRPNADYANLVGQG